MNNIRVEVGEKFIGKRSRVLMEIVGIDKDEAIIKEVDTGRQFRYCIESLRRCEMERVVEK